MPMFPFSNSELAARFAPEWYAASLTTRDEAAIWLQRSGHTKRLAILAPPNHVWLSQFSGESQSFDRSYVLKWCPTDYANARALHAAVPNLRPTLLGLTTSAGCGDRLGRATPGHVRAFEAVRKQSGAEPIAPIFAQQSIREMTRTHRTPAEVMADATWGAFEGGWLDRVGADADHLKTTADIDVCAEAGFTFYTIDPGAHVDGAADGASPDAIKQKVAALRWADLESSPVDLQRQYADRAVDLEYHRIVLAAESVWRAAAKYGNALAHVTTMYRHLAAKGVPFELEVSVDETDMPTTHAEHIYIVSELRRLGVKWVSLAPRYIGRFEKAVDYIGDVDALEADLAGHAAIARTCGPYKLSLHSGSDKFSVYPLIVAATKGLVHLKTAGTSYLEALRTLAAVTPALFRDILEFSIKRYETDRLSYHVSADVHQMPVARELANDELPGLLDQFHAREVLHVTFGSVLAQFGGDIRTALMAHELDYYHALETHFVRHLTPFAHRT